MKKTLEIKGLSKKFNQTQALENVNFSLEEGEIHGLIGANGSGKSTLMNILFGSRHIRETGGYSGDIYIDGKKKLINSQEESRKNGIGMVHQELSLLSELSIRDNIKINRENTIKSTDSLRSFSLVDNKKNLSDSKEALSKIGLNLDPLIKVRSLSTNIKQFIEIAREIDKDKLKILMLDEPTSSLNLEETKILLDHLKVISSLGTSIIFTSHRLEEIVEVCDKVTVLRDGRVINTYKRQEFDIKQLALDMIGKEVIQASSKSRDISSENIMSFKDVELTVRSEKFRDISLDIRRGEILGITGLAGHGQEIFGYGIMGLYNMKGDVEYEGKKLRQFNSRTALRNNIYLLPDERKEMGLLMNKSIWENTIFETYDKRRDFLKYPRLNLLSTLNHENINKYVEKIVQTLNIKLNSIEQAVGELSGGNQQKVCVARAITIDPKLLFVGDPTRGIDIYSKEIILKLLLDLNKKNNTSVVISSGEISELTRICDRIAIMYENKVFKIFEGNYDSDEFRLAISGKELDENEDKEF